MFFAKNRYHRGETAGRRNGYRHNVLLQMESPRSYRVVRKAAREGRLHVHAWRYEIGSRTIFRHAREREQFEAIREEE